MTKSETVNSFLKLAKGDLQSSKILHKARLFPQSIYSFQQAVEKANKALVIYADFLTLTDAQKLSHNHLKLVRQVLKIQSVGMEGMIAARDRIPNFLMLLKENNLDPDSYIKLLSKADEGLSWINDQTKLENLTSNKLKEILALIQGTSRELKKINKGKAFLYFKEYLPDFLEKLQLTEVATAPGVTNEDITPDLDTEKIAEIMAVIFVQAFEFAGAAFSVHILGFVFDRLVAKVRYPTITDQDLLDPTAQFNGRLPLVKRLPEFHLLLGQAIRALEKKMLS
jgi:hypothetical protein